LTSKNLKVLIKNAYTEGNTLLRNRTSKLTGVLFLAVQKVRIERKGSIILV